MTVALVHAVLFAALCLVVMRIGALVWSPGVGIAAGIAAALYPPFPYWAAMSLTEILTTLTLTLAVWFFLRGMRSKVALDFVLAGLAFGYLAITRPAWALLAPGLAGLLTLLAWWRRDAVGLTLRRFVVMGGAMLLVVVPWVGFVYVHFHVVSLNPVAFWRTAYWGYWQGVFPGRTAVELDQVTDSDLHGDAPLAGSGRSAPTWTACGPTWRRRAASVPCGAASKTNTRRSEARHRRRLARDHSSASARRRFLELPVPAVDVRIVRALGGRHSDPLLDDQRGPRRGDPRYRARPGHPPRAVRGGGRRAPSRRWRRGSDVLLTLLYTEAVHVFIHTDIRFSLPVKPLVVLLAVLAVSRLARVRVFHGATAINAGAATRVRG